MKEELLQTEII